MESIRESLKQKAASKTHAGPTHVAYTVKDLGEGKESQWIRIGGAFAHRDGVGFDVKLDALPIGDRILLRVPKPKEGSEGK